MGQEAIETKGYPAPASPLVVAVVVNWNRGEDTLECLRSLEQQSYPRMGIIVVDNGSEDGSPESIQRNFPGVELIRLSHNTGFAGGFNQGIERALSQGGDYVLILNNDTVSDRLMVEKLMGDIRPGTGVAFPKIYYYDDPRRIWSVGARRQFLTLEMTDKATGQLDRGQWDKVQERDYGTGCALLVPREVFAKIGLFDERYFAYYEDLDFSFRVKEAGFRMILVPEARLWHKVAQTSGGLDNPLERYLMAKGSVLFFGRHGGGWRRLFIVPYRLGSAVKTTFRLLLRRKYKSVSAYWKGLSEGLKLVFQDHRSEFNSE
jgi:GT2 family glycosyltransferase